MSTKVSYGSLSPAVIAALDVIVRGLISKGLCGENPITLKKLSELIQFCDSGIWGDESIDPALDPHIFRVSDFKGDFLLDYESAPPRNIPEAKLSKFQLVEGDILVVKSSGSANQVISGRTAVFQGSGKVRYAASNFLMRLRPKADIDPFYLAFILGSPPIREIVADTVKTMTYPNLPFGLYSQILVPIIPYSDQKCLSTFFSCLFEGRPMPILPNYLYEQQKCVSYVTRLASRINEIQNLRAHAASETEGLIISIHRTCAEGRTKRLGDILSLREEAVRIAPDRSYPQVGIRIFCIGSA